MFDTLLTQIEFPLTVEKQVYTMRTLLESYQTLLAGEHIDGVNNYRSQKLKKRLRKHYGDKIVFQPPHNPSESELVFSTSVSIGDALQAAKCLNESMEDVKFEAELCPEVSIDPENANQILHHAAQIL